MLPYFWCSAISCSAERPESALRISHSVENDARKGPLNFRSRYHSKRDEMIYTTRNPARRENHRRFDARDVHRVRQRYSNAIELLGDSARRSCDRGIATHMASGAHEVKKGREEQKQIKLQANSYILHLCVTLCNRDDDHRGMIVAGAATRSK